MVLLPEAVLEGLVDDVTSTLDVTEKEDDDIADPVELTKEVSTDVGEVVCVIGAVSFNV